MMQIKENGAILCLPEKTEQPLFTVCCIGGEQLAGELAAIEKLLPPTALLICPAENWAALSPLSAPPLRDGEPPFTPGAQEMLEKIHDWLGHFAGRYPMDTSPERCGIAGYSLAGLTVLYALHTGDAHFGWFYSLSGSLWLEGWDEFAIQHRPAENANVWLSLGKKESKSGNMRMRRVELATIQQADLLRQTLPEQNVQLTFHPGGHFHDIPARWAAALQWKRQIPVCLKNQLDSRKEICDD